MSANKKRYWIIVGLVGLLVLTGYLNYRLNLTDAIEDEPNVEAMAQSQAELAPVPLATPAMQIEVGSNAQPMIDSQEALAASSAGFFATFRSNRDSVRAKELEVLETIIIDANTSSEQISDAQAQKLSIVDSMEKEMTIENMIKAKGFADAAVTIHKGSVNVVVDKVTLTDPEVAQIFDLCIRESGEKPENIKIMPKE